MLEINNISCANSEKSVLRTDAGWGFNNHQKRNKKK